MTEFVEAFRAIRNECKAGRMSPDELVDAWKEIEVRILNATLAGDREIKRELASWRLGALVIAFTNPPIHQLTNFFLGA